MGCRRTAQLIDSEGFRANVGIVLANDREQVLWARRARQPDAWQFPQGGINQGEKPEEALYRELHEEVGLQPADVELVAATQGWLRYRLPRHLIRHRQKPLCVGQKQKWFLLRLRESEGRIRFDTTERPEFDDWRWVSYWYPVNQVIAFKQDVYRRALRELSAHLFDSRAVRRTHA